MGRSEVIVLMGVSGCGKSTVGRSLSKVTGFAFYDADDFHPRSNVEKMRQGVPLTDADRQPWLEALAQFLGQKSKKGESVVLACSALKERYRAVLSSGQPSIKFVFLDGSSEIIEARLKAREGHFMPVGLLDSQLQALEIPENAQRVSIDQPVSVIVEEICSRFWPENL